MNTETIVTNSAHIAPTQHSCHLNITMSCNDASRAGSPAASANSTSSSTCNRSCTGLSTGAPEHTSHGTVQHGDHHQPKGCLTACWQQRRPTHWILHLSRGVVNMLNIRFPQMPCEQLADVLGKAYDTCPAVPAPSYGGHQPLSQQQAQEADEQAQQALAAQGVYVLDTRRPDEYSVSHLFGTLNFYSKPLRSKRYGIKASIPPDLSQCLERHKDATIILYDAVGLRSGIVGRKLRRQGFSRVVILSGCYYQWLHQRRPVWMEDSGQPLPKALPQHFLGSLALETKLHARWWSWKQVCGCLPASHQHVVEDTVAES